MVEEVGRNIPPFDYLTVYKVLLGDSFISPISSFLPVIVAVAVNRRPA
jgi:hypothetical protein